LILVVVVEELMMNVNQINVEILMDVVVFDD
jgi:hypothetical protein